MLFLQAHMHAIARKGLLDHDVKRMWTSVRAIHAKMMEVVLMIPEHSDVFACQVREFQMNSKFKRTN